MLRSLFSVLLIGVCIGSFVQGCNDAPNSVGSQFITDTVNTVALTSADSSYILRNSATQFIRTKYYNSSGIFIGKAGTMQAVSLVRFINIPDSLASLSESDIISATMIMRPARYVFGDSSSNNLSFDVVKVQKQWIVSDSNSTFSIKPFYTDLISGAGVPDPTFFESSPAATFTGSIPLRDTIPHIEFPLTQRGKQVLVEWFKNQPDSNLRKNTWGFGFLPQTSSNVVRLFSADGSNVADSNKIRVKVVYRKPGNTTNDTLLLISGNDAFFCNDELPTDTTKMVTQSVVARTGSIDFDISSIPADRAILNVELVLTLDRNATRMGNTNLDSIVTASYRDSANNVSIVSTGRLKAGTGNKYYFSSSLTQALSVCRRTASRQGKGTITFTATTGTPNSLCFYGVRAVNPADRPRLTVVYASRPTLGVKK